jgi:hypothetical protein
VCCSAFGCVLTRSTGSFVFDWLCGMAQGFAPYMGLLHYVALGLVASTKRRGLPTRVSA